MPGPWVIGVVKSWQSRFLTCMHKFMSRLISYWLKLAHTTGSRVWASDIWELELRHMKVTLFWGVDHGTFKDFRDCSRGTDTDFPTWCLGVGRSRDFWGFRDSKCMRQWYVGVWASNIWKHKPTTSESYIYSGHWLGTLILWPIPKWCLDTRSSHDSGTGILREMSGAWTWFPNCSKKIPWATKIWNKHCHTQPT